MKRLVYATFGSLFLISAAFALIDTNGNGLSDLWEKESNDDELFTESFDRQGDPDGDGWTNEQEATAGTSPFEANLPDGFLRPQTTHIPATYHDPDNDGNPDILTPDALILTWPTAVGKLYALQISTDLTEGSWIEVDTPFVGSGNENESTIILPNSDKLFCRVSINDTDTDGDALTNAEEHELGTNPLLTDTDSDGVSDADEFHQGTGMTNANSFALAWRRIERNLSYDFTWGTAPQPHTGNLSLNATWNETLNTSEALTSPIGFTALDDRLTNISFHATPPEVIFTDLAAAEGNAQIPVSSPTQNATLSHQRVWLTRSPATLHTLEKKVVVFTDRTLNGTPEAQIFTLETFTLPANQPASNSIDLEEGFISDGPSGGSGGPPGSSNAAIPGGHLELFSKQLVPLRVEDDQPATGVDNVSISAATSDVGRQDKFWIMAPCNIQQPGVPPVENAVVFNMPFELSVNVIPICTNAETVPIQLNLGAAPTPVVWRGTNAHTSNELPVFKTTSLVDVPLPIGVKVMKRRTVKVAVHKVHRPGSRAFPVRDWSKISDELNKIFDPQINSIYSVEFFDTSIPYDTNGNGNLVCYNIPTEGGEEYEGLLSHSSIQATRSTHDITVLLIDDMAFYDGIGLPDQDRTAYGHARPTENTCVVGVGLRRLIQQGGYSIQERTAIQIASTVSHEIGHILLGAGETGGHPDEGHGPAPLTSLGLAHHKTRLLCSGINRNAGSRLLVKAEWDEAEKWLKENPDRREDESNN